ncbi:serine-rich coiled-coil domain-containing protein 1 isoform X2 [Sceloporus undulatus]|uniref:serine-rich coiled-coil domain-containing protein 1 isoform X2 n=1 Tax=Sceloporus undulatus TaxID=8520 RepID=UPI001C4D1368|nr:serine-rich coiled-coil domain-containing protein 1 isoform X2 [Sceloporus undulatus]XP_042324718.1 serine-rich coiled-coil domain-containing protein 1 isoform X2 [Sceloporus undulatus]
MGDSGSRRSIIVSRLPIFRRSISRRHDSLPSSPTSNSTVGVHSSSPSSTNSSSGSTGKRRSLFRTPSISFHYKKGSEQKTEPPSQNVGILNGSQSNHSNVLQKLSLEEHLKSRGRHSVSFGSSRSKKITRSLTEDFEKGREPSVSKNVFINCIRSGKNEGDDSGFTEEQSRSSVRHSSRRLLPKSFSTHYRFSKPVPQSQSASCEQPSSCLLDTKPSVESESVSARSSPSCSAEVIECVGSSSQSPMLSADLTTVQTPSEFLALTEDSVSEVDGLPNCGNLHTETFAHNGSTSQIFLSPVTAVTVAAPLLSRKADHAESASHCGVISPKSHRARNVLFHEAGAVSENYESNQNCAEVLVQELPAKQTRHTEEANSVAEAQLKPFVLNQGEVVEHCPNAQQLLRDHEEIRTPESLRETIPITGSKSIPMASEHQCFQIQQGYEMNHTKVNLASSFSPYREGRFIEKRLRSSSEGTAGSSRMILKPKDGNLEEPNSLRKQRTSSSSSKMNSMDVLNNLGSCDLDEDDLMLDLEFLEDQHHRHSVCREDSHQSIVSCAAVLLTPIESAEGKKKEQPKMPEVTKQNLSLKLSKEVDRGETRCPRVSQLASSPSVEWPFTAMEEGGGMESLPFRLMMQDCTAVKTLLLKMKRVLQESTDMSPASSTHSLPVSPLTEEPLSFKDIMKDECSALKLQLKERDELIFQLREELEKAQHLPKTLVCQVDKSTQTELVGHDALWNSSCTEGSVYKPISISLVPALFN